MADLATLANVGGVVGLADVVIRCTTKLYELVRRISTASQSAARLQALLQEFVGVIGLVRAWAEDLEQARNPTWKPHENCDQIRRQVYVSLRRAHEQIENLLRGKSTSQVRPGWLYIFKSNVAFALNEAQIEHGIKAINHHQLTLTNLIQVRTSHDVNLLHRQMLVLSQDIQNTNQAIAVSTQASQQELVSSYKRIELAIQGSTEHLRSTIHAASSRTTDIGKLIMKQYGVQQKPSHVAQPSDVAGAVEIDCQFISNALMQWLPGVRIFCEASGRYTLEPFRLERSEYGRLAFKSASLQPSQILLHLSLVAPRLDRIRATSQKTNIRKNLELRKETIYSSSKTNGGGSIQAAKDLDMAWISEMLQRVTYDLYAAGHIGTSSSFNRMQCKQHKTTEKQSNTVNILKAYKPHQYQYSASDTAGVLAVQWRSLENRKHRLEQISLAFAINPFLSLDMTGIFASFTRVQMYLPRIVRQPAPPLPLLLLSDSLSRVRDWTHGPENERVEVMKILRHQCRELFTSLPLPHCWNRFSWEDVYDMGPLPTHEHLHRDMERLLSEVETEDITFLRPLLRPGLNLISWDWEYDAEEQKMHTYLYLDQVCFY